MGKIKPFFLSMVWASIIIIIDFIPANPPTIGNSEAWLIGPDKITHFFQHFLLAILLFYGFFKLFPSRKPVKIYGMIFLICVIVGLFIEIVQEYFIPYRSFCSGDLLANVLGVLFAIVFIAIFFKWIFPSSIMKNFMAQGHNHVHPKDDN